MKTIQFMSKISLLLLVLAMTSCGNAAKKSNEAQAQETSEAPMQHNHSESMVKDGPEYTSKYVCPMHCEGSGSDNEGKCPVCGMTYVLNEDYNEGADHQDEHNH